MALTLGSILLSRRTYITESNETWTPRDRQSLVTASIASLLLPCTVKRRGKIIQGSHTYMNMANLGISESVMVHITLQMATRSFSWATWSSVRCLATSSGWPSLVILSLLSGDNEPVSLSVLSWSKLELSSVPSMSTTVWSVLNWVTDSCWW